MTSVLSLFYFNVFPSIFIYSDAVFSLLETQWAMFKLTVLCDVGIFISTVFAYCPLAWE